MPYAASVTLGSPPPFAASYLKVRFGDQFGGGVPLSHESLLALLCICQTLCSSFLSFHTRRSSS